MARSPPGCDGRTVIAWRLPGCCPSGLEPSPPSGVAVVLVTRGDGVVPVTRGAGVVPVTHGAGVVLVTRVAELLFVRRHAS